MAPGSAPANGTQASAVEVIALPRKRALPWYVEMWVQLVRSKPTGTFGGAVLLVLVLTALLADVLAPYPRDEVNLAVRLAPPSPQHLMGTDPLGRDLLSRVVYGARVSMAVGVGAVGLGQLIAVLIGVVSGYFGGLFDLMVQRLVDAWLAFPRLVILLSIMAILGPGLGNVLIALALLQAFVGSRIIRSAVLAVKESQYLEAARATGCGHLRVILQHILPNIMAPVIVIVTVDLGAVIIAEASLSFLGYGIPPPTPSWGGMLSGTATHYMVQAPWLAVFPGLALSLAVFGINMLGDGLRDVLDPRLRGLRAARYR